MAARGDSDYPSEPEQVLYRRLVEALPDYLVLPQVQLVRVVRFKRGQGDRAVWNRISQLSIDFLIAKPDTSIVAAVVEGWLGSFGQISGRDKWTTLLS